jgi:hypothetical protein
LIIFNNHMFYSEYINHEFSDYLNRYCKGIILLKNRIQEISVGYELSEAFSNHTCRFLIDVKLIDFASFTKEEQEVANRYLYNNYNGTGSQFVSFSYKPRGNYNINIEEIRSFIMHYQFAESLFKGFIADFLDKDCPLKIEPLDKEPLFVYAEDYLSKIKYQEDDRNSFEKKYLALIKREFDADRFYHDRLNEAAKKFPELEREDFISDKEICNAQGGSTIDLRSYILEENIPFNAPKYGRVIDEIYIDLVALKSKLESYIAKPYTDIRPKAIIQLIDQKQSEKNAKRKIFNSLKTSSGVEIGDYILVEKDWLGSDKQEIGLIKDIEMGYNGSLSLKYNVLKKDLSESRSALNATELNCISYILKNSIFETNKANLPFDKTKFFASNGYKNPAFKKSKTR